jgi:hypothetical protein
MRNTCDSLICNYFNLQQHLALMILSYRSVMTCDVLMSIKESRHNFIKSTAYKIRETNNIICLVSPTYMCACVCTHTLLHFYSYGGTVICHYNYRSKIVTKLLSKIFDQQSLVLQVGGLARGQQPHPEKGGGGSMLRNQTACLGMMDPGTENGLMRY